MSNMNAIVWFDIYVDDLDRAVGFYETVLGRSLEPMEDPTGETQMMSFPAEMNQYGAGGALTKAPFASPGAGGTVVDFPPNGFKPPASSRSALANLFVIFSPEF